MEKWITFYENSPSNLENVTDFIEKLERINDPTIILHRAKIMMHQTQRIITLADDIIQIREGKDSLQLFFVLTCAENIAKLYHHFDQEGKSKEYVRRFFSEFIVDNDRTVLENSFFRLDGTQFNIKSVVDCLYSVRCDVVHEGRYWGFHFHDGQTLMINMSPDVTVHITFSEFRAIVIRGCVYAIQNYVEANSS